MANDGKVVAVALKKNLPEAGPEDDPGPVDDPGPEYIKTIERMK